MGITAHTVHVDDPDTPADAMRATIHALGPEGAIFYAPAR